MDVKKKHASKTGFDPNKEFNEISDIVKQFLENPIPVEKLVEVMEKRRTKALARAIGFQSLGKLLSLAKGMETSLVRSFADSLRRKNGKVHYWDGLEGVDPNLLSCVKYCFFDVYELLQKDLVTS